MLQGVGKLKKANNEDANQTCMRVKASIKNF